MTLNRLLILVPLLNFLSFTAFAQSFFGPSETATNKNVPTTTETPANQILSNDAFQNVVNQLKQQSQSTLNQQSQQVTATPTPATTTTKKTPSPLIPETAAPATIENNDAVTPPPITMPMTNPSSSSLAPLATTPSSTNKSQAPVTPSNQNQPYTGFGSSSNTGNNSSPNNNSSSGKSSGWNIKY